MKELQLNCLRAIYGEPSQCFLMWLSLLCGQMYFYFIQGRRIQESRKECGGIIELGKGCAAPPLICWGEDTNSIFSTKVSGKTTWHFKKIWQGTGGGRWPPLHVEWFQFTHLRTQTTVALFFFRPRTHMGHRPRVVHNLNGEFGRHHLSAGVRQKAPGPSGSSGPRLDVAESCQTRTYPLRNQPRETGETTLTPQR